MFELQVTAVISIAAAVMFSLLNAEFCVCVCCGVQNPLNRSKLTPEHLRGESDLGLAALSLVKRDKVFRLGVSIHNS